MGGNSSKPSPESPEAELAKVCKVSPTLALEDGRCQNACEADPEKPCDGQLKSICSLREYYNQFPYCKTVCKRHPEYCKNAMSDEDYCFAGIDQFMTERCQSYCFDNETECNKKKQEYCSVNGVDKEICKE